MIHNLNHSGEVIADYLVNSVNEKIKREVKPLDARCILPFRANL